MLTPFAVVYRYEDLALDDAPDVEWVHMVASTIQQWAASAVGSGPSAS